MRLKLFTLGLVAAALTACATQPPAKLTPAQVAARICPDLQLINQTFIDTPQLLSPEDMANLSKAQPIVDHVCSLASTAPKPSDLKALAGAAVSILVEVVQASALPPDRKLAITVGVNLAKNLIAQQLVEDAAEASAPVAVPAPAASAAQ